MSFIQLGEYIVDPHAVQFAKEINGGKLVQFAGGEPIMLSDIQWDAIVKARSQAGQSRV
ncbi:MAG: hypothetical protein H8K09_13230 [Nitrospira sp.]|nr:hypothetical protein [Nitrospira sp.]